MMQILTQNARLPARWSTTTTISIACTQLLDTQLCGWRDSCDSLPVAPCDCVGQELGYPDLIGVDLHLCAWVRSWRDGSDSLPVVLTLLCTIPFAVERACLLPIN